MLYSNYSKAYSNIGLQSWFLHTLIMEGDNE
jgi:hypothetical protein